MKQTIRLLLAALTIVLGLASCATNDLPVDPDVLVKEMSGMWWSLADQEGTYKDATDSYPYTRMGQAICFNEDGTGYGVTFFFNDDQGDPIAIIGGDGLAPFTYTSKADGRLSLDFTDAYKEAFFITFAGYEQAILANHGNNKPDLTFFNSFCNTLRRCEFIETYLKTSLESDSVFIFLILIVIIERSISSTLILAISDFLQPV